MTYRIGCSVFQNHYINNPNLGHVNYAMSCETLFAFVSIAALSALEGLLSTMRPHVALQITRRCASIIALVTLAWLFSSVLPHHVKFHFIVSDAGILTHCASVRLFPRVGPFVLLRTI